MSLGSFLEPAPSEKTHPGSCDSPLMERPRPRGAPELSPRAGPREPSSRPGVGGSGSRCRGVAASAGLSLQSVLLLGGFRNPCWGASSAACYSVT